MPIPWIFVDESLIPLSVASILSTTSQICSMFIGLLSISSFASTENEVILPLFLMVVEP
jgi:hypothetical protein